jgi:uncharacterized protein
MSRRAVAVAALLLLAGCSFSILAPKPDTSKFYVLTATGHASPAASSSGNLSVGIGPVRIPGYLDRSAIATRLSENQIVYSGNDRWAEPLDQNFRAVLAADLAGSLGDARVIQHVWGTSETDYLLEIDVRRFECDAHGGCQLLGRYVVKNGKSGAPLIATDVAINRSVSGGAATGASVAALSATVGQLSDQIAAALRELAAAHRTSG